MKFFIPKRGDKVRVRLASGEVVDANYINIGHDKCHRVDFCGKTHYSVRRKPKLNDECRFVGPGAAMEARS